MSESRRPNKQLGILGLSDRARDLHFRSLVLDSHVDTTQRIFFDGFDLGQRHTDGCVDIPRLREGGIGAVFFAIWQTGDVTGPRAVEHALAQIDAVRQQVLAHSGDLVLAQSANDICEAHRRGKIAIVLALEGGHMIDSNLDVLRNYFAVGVRYMTLTHVLNVEWADSSTDKPVRNGLSDFGKQVIREMNRLGMMIDVSHVSDKTFYDVLAVSEAPIFVSHSNCRALCDSPRNLSDDMIKALAAENGVIQINFHTGFLSQQYRQAMTADPSLKENAEKEAASVCGDNLACLLLQSEKIMRRLVSEGKLPRVEWQEIVGHIDHAVQLVGADHVGIGSDFDGANMPFGMEDASHFPQITVALLEKGYSDCDIQKILGGNTLRLMQDVEAAATKTEDIR